MPARLRVTLVKSPIGHTARTRGTLRALGLRRVGQVVEVDDNEQMRGMTRTVRFLLRTEEAASESTSTKRAGREQADAAPAADQPEPEASAEAKSDRPKRAPRAKKETNE
ncbi:MAG TPA: 50S ribosomal protein L30 [Candidatus Limnocylindrales bacterium]|nr:50S ribosomal protein L30 [Candidatus Limnocylindrales bacterium]